MVEQYFHSLHVFMAWCLINSGQEQLYIYLQVRFEILTTVSVDFLDVAPFCFIDGYQHIRGTFYLHLSYPEDVGNRYS